MKVIIREHVSTKLHAQTRMRTQTLSDLLQKNAFVEVAKVKKVWVEMGVLVWDFSKRVPVFVVLVRYPDHWVAVTAYVPTEDKFWNGRKVVTRDNIEWAKRKGSKFVR